MMCARAGVMLCETAAVAYTKRIEIRWRDMDGFGHVNNSVYLTYLEEARDEFYTELLGHDTVGRCVARRVAIEFESGLTQADVRTRDAIQLLVLTQADGVVEVTLEVVRIGTSSVTTREVITALSDGRVSARAESVMVHCDADRERPAPLPEEARQLLEGVSA